MRAPLTALALAAALGAGGLVAAGCGGDNEEQRVPPPAAEQRDYAEPVPEDTPDVPEVTEELKTEQPETPRSTEPPEDTAENDLPPEPGSPQERFERELERRCKANPESCAEY